MLPWVSSWGSGIICAMPCKAAATVPAHTGQLLVDDCPMQYWWAYTWMGGIGLDMPARMGSVCGLGRSETRLATDGWQCGFMQE